LQAASQAANALGELRAEQVRSLYGELALQAAGWVAAVLVPLPVAGAVAAGFVNIIALELDRSRLDKLQELQAVMADLFFRGLPLAVAIYSNTARGIDLVGAEPARIPGALLTVTGGVITQTTVCTRSGQVVDVVDNPYVDLQIDNTGAVEASYSVGLVYGGVFYLLGDEESGYVTLPAGGRKVLRVDFSRSPGSTVLTRGAFSSLPRPASRSDSVRLHLFATVRDQGTFHLGQSEIALFDEPAALDGAGAGLPGAEDGLVFPYPVRSFVYPDGESPGWRLEIEVVNFDAVPRPARVEQPLAEGVSVVESAGAAVQDGSLVWDLVVPPLEGSAVSCLLLPSVRYGEKLVLPPALVLFPEDGGGGLSFASREVEVEARVPVLATPDPLTVGCEEPRVSLGVSYRNLDARSASDIEVVLRHVRPEDAPEASSHGSGGATPTWTTEWTYPTPYASSRTSSSAAPTSSAKTLRTRTTTGGSTSPTGSRSSRSSSWTGARSPRRAWSVARTRALMD